MQRGKQSVFKLPFKTPSLQLPGPPCRRPALLPPLPSSPVELPSTLHFGFSFLLVFQSPLCPFWMLLSPSLLPLPVLLSILQQLPKPYFYLSSGGWSGAAPMPRCSSRRDRLTASEGESVIEQK